MAGNDEAVACVFAYEGTFFRLMSYQYSEDLATVNMNMQIEFNVKDSEFTREATVRDVACMVGLGFLTSSMVGVLPVFSTKIVDMAPDGATPAAYASLTYFESYLPADKQRKFRKLMTYAFAKQLIMHRPTRLKSNRKRVHDLMDNAQSVIQAAVFTKLKVKPPRTPQNPFKIPSKHPLKHPQNARRPASTTRSSRRRSSPRTGRNASSASARTTSTRNRPCSRSARTSTTRRTKHPRETADASRRISLPCT